MSTSLMQTLALSQTLVAAAAGGVATWLGTLVVERYKANKAASLERIKASEALRLEFAKRRAKKFAQFWTEFDDLEARVTRLLYDILHQRSRTNLELFLRDAAPDDELAVHLRVLRERLKHDELQDTFAARFEETFGLAIAEITARTATLSSSVSAARFWLGRKIAPRLAWRCGTLTIYIQTLGQLASLDSELVLEKLKALASAIKDENKDDLDSLLATM